MSYPARAVLSCLAAFHLSSAFLHAADPVPVSRVPDAPRGVAMTGNTPDSITLSWYRSPDEVTEYMVYGAGEADGDYQKVATVKERTATISGLKPGTNYYYKVAAANPKGESAQSSVAPAFTIAAWEPKPFPVRLAKNMCISLNEKVICNEQPLSGNLANLVDGSMPRVAG